MMQGNTDYLLGQILSLAFYVMTLTVYARARKVYRGGKIAAAIKLIMVFMVILFWADFADYFLPLLVPLTRDSILIVKILLKLTALCVLFFGGVRFFTDTLEPEPAPAARETSPQTRSPGSATDQTLVIQGASDTAGRASKAGLPDFSDLDTPPTIAATVEAPRPSTPQTTTAEPSSALMSLPPLARLIKLMVVVFLCVTIPAGAYYVYKKHEINKAQQELLQRLTKEKREMEALMAQIQQAKAEAQKAKEELAEIEHRKAMEQKRLTDLEQRKAAAAAEKEREEKVAHEKAAERERLAEIERQNKTARAEKERQEALRKARREEQQRAAGIKRKKRLARKDRDMSAVDWLLVAARKALADEQYDDAKRNYEAALKSVSQSEFKGDPEFIKYRRDIEAALQQPDMTLGTRKGYVKYQGRWMPKTEYETLRFRAGYVKYKGRLLPYMDLKPTIDAVAAPVVRSFLTAKYSGRRVHTKNVKFEKLVLNRSDAAGSRFTIYYDWEAWTLKEFGTGTCALTVRYTVENDDWRVENNCK